MKSPNGIFNDYKEEMQQEGDNMELNGIALAKSVLRMIRDNDTATYVDSDEKCPYFKDKEDMMQWVQHAIDALDEQMAYLAGNNPDKMYGYKQTYNKEV